MRFNKKIFIIVALFISVCIFYFLNRSTAKDAYDFGVKYTIERKGYLESLEDYLINEKLIPTDSSRVFITYFTRNKSKIRISTWHGEENSSEKSAPTPNFVKDLYVDMYLTIEVERDGFRLINLYRYGFKHCTYKYFFEKHNLNNQKYYEGNYEITTPAKPNTSERNCYIIDDNWIMLVRERKRG